MSHYSHELKEISREIERLREEIYDLKFETNFNLEKIANSLETLVSLLKPNFENDDD